MNRRLIAEVRQARTAFIISVTSNLLDGILILGQAWYLSRIINHVFLDHASRASIQSLVFTLVALIGLRALNWIISQFASSEVAIRVKADLRERLNDHIMALGPAFTYQERSGELAAAATGGIEALDSFFREYLPALFTSVLVPLAILIVVFPHDLLTFIVMLVTAPLIPVFMILIGKVAGALARDQYAQLGGMSAHFLDVMQGLTTLKLFNRSKAQIAIIERITDRFRESTMGVLRIAFLSAFTLELLATLSVAVIAVEIGLRLLAGGLPFQQALFLLVIAPELYIPLRQLGAKFHTGRDGAAAADRIYTILNTPLPAHGGSTAIQTVNRVRFENVSFIYDGNRPALQSVSFAVEAGQHIAFVGMTGSGKSTIASLLLGFIHPDEGQITAFDGEHKHDFSHLDLNTWRNHLAWVPQRGYLFNTNVIENIRIGQFGASDEQVKSAAKTAEAHAFIEQLPHGYDTLLGENGTRLSGGQGQRIALARALLRDAEVVIFDEATSHLDALTEDKITHNLIEHLQGRIQVTIAHHLGTISHADRIYVLDAGRIVESGTHHDLLRQQGAYYSLLQASGESSHE